MAQMEWREAIAEASSNKDAAVLEAFSKRLKHKIGVQIGILGATLDEKADFSAAEICVNELRFYEKLRLEIGEALDKINSQN